LFFAIFGFFKNWVATDALSLQCLRSKTPQFFCIVSFVKKRKRKWSHYFGGPTLLKKISLLSQETYPHTHISLFSWTTCPHTHNGLFSQATCPHMLIVVYFHGQPAHMLILVYFQGRPAHTLTLVYFQG
jgi:hypothetical protein